MSDSAALKFWKTVLVWDYIHLLTSDEELGLKHVKNTYENIDDYISTFEPLLLEEVKSHIVQKQDNEKKRRGRSNILKDHLKGVKWLDGVTVECRQSNDFNITTIAYESHDQEAISPNDLIFLTNDIKFQANHSHAFAMLDYSEKDAVTLRMSSLTSHVGDFLYMHKVCSLSTILREYVALHSVSSLPFKDLILTATQTNLNFDDRAWKIPDPLMKSIKVNHNDSQLAAINAGLSRRAFVLIQGPPGTGKTQTILGLLSAILHASPHSVTGRHEIRVLPELSNEEKRLHWERASPWLFGINPRDAIMPVDGDDGFFPTSGNEMKPDVIYNNRKYRARVLVCAPSNSALDEIVMRVLSTGVRDVNGHAYNPKIVRIGLNPHHSVETVSMNYLLEQRLAGMDMTTGKLGRGAPKKDVQSSILNEAVIVFSTLSFSGSILSTESNHKFDVIIIDEAAQAVEPATIIPLAHKCKQVFLVGDPVQLPATVISETARQYGYGTSLFERFQKAGYPVHMLKTQYRMHPEIRSFPSKEFYNEELKDGPDVKAQTERDWHAYSCFGPFCFFDIHEGEETQPSGKGCWENAAEVNFIVHLYHNLVTRHPILKASSQLAIISPYRHQVKLFQGRFKESFGADSQKIVDINTVDGFQGREKDVVIFSCVRASKDKGIGFVSDFRRMNVGITRAKSSILVVGSASTLKKDKFWKNLIDSAEKRNSLFKVSEPYASFFSDKSLKSMEMVLDESNDVEMATEFEDVEYNIGDYGNPVNADIMQEDVDYNGDGGGLGEED